MAKLKRTVSRDSHDGLGAGRAVRTAGSMSIDSIKGFPYGSFEELRTAVSERKVNLGVDTLAAAHWAHLHAPSSKKALIALLSALLIIAGVASLVAGVYTRDYWFLAAIPVMAAAFYLSNPAWTYHKWVTALGAVSVAVVLDLLVNGLFIPALIVAYAGLTFAAVRAAGYINNSSFRKAILNDEADFVAAFRSGFCSVRDEKTDRVWVHASVELNR
ncbi:MAG TPA: hypothetical protein VJX67_14020 [Blastocatellia bacterium]|nr:hypothetical protein [Blastocatellia bacterium]